MKEAGDFNLQLNSDERNKMETCWILVPKIVEQTCFVLRTGGQIGCSERIEPNVPETYLAVRDASNIEGSNLLISHLRSGIVC